MNDPTLVSDDLLNVATRHSQPSKRECCLSIVIPCFNEEQVLPETAVRLRQLLDGLLASGKITADSQVVFVDDGSTDRTWEIIRAQHSADRRFRGLKLSANRGHQVALVAGLCSASGNAIVSIDADLQDDLTAIETMVDRFLEGFDVVYGVRNARKRDTFFKRSTAEWYYRLLGVLGVEVVFNHADFRLLSRRALEALKQYSEVNLFVRGIVPLIGFRSGIVYYERQERFAGQSKYSIRKMLALAADGVTSFTAFPLRLISLLGICVSIFSAGMALWALWVRLFTTMTVPGWASSVIPVFFFGGVQLLSIGVLGEYVAKIYFETKRRPRYFVEEFI